MKHISNKKGSTLIEVLISMFIVAIASLGGIALYHNSSEIEGIALHKKLALELANSRMEEFRAMSFTHSDLTVGTPVTTAVNIGGLTGSMIRTVTLVSPYKRIQLDVQWQESGKNEKTQNITLVTMKKP